MAALPHAEISGPSDLYVTGIECDSRRVSDGDLFVAIRGGEEQDRHQFVGDALSRGAIAAVVEENVDMAGNVTRISVRNSREALAALSARFYGNPADELRMVGVTGTNGKTTTAMLIQSILQGSGIPCGYLGTLGSLAGTTMEPMANTTPEASELHRQLRAMVSSGREAVALEVSSHALALGRVSGIEFSAAVFTNLTRDHLDFHGCEAAYLKAKEKLFHQLKDGSEPRAVINLDDRAGSALSGRLKASVVTFGRHQNADVRLTGEVRRGAKTVLSLATPAGDFDIATVLTGNFNCSNVMAAVGCGLALGIGPNDINRALAEFEGLPGRFERVDEGQQFDVIVDYAHTPAGLETILHTARELTEKRLICLFGCGGDRDTGKRPLMGRIAGELSDLVILTSDNPRSESPESIIEQIHAGMSDPERATVITDRREAIASAIASAHAGDVVVLAGKGDEDYQIFADEVVDFDDREVARECLTPGRRSEAG